MKRRSTKTRAAKSTQRNRRRRSVATADGQGCQRQAAVEARETQLRQFHTDAVTAIGFDRAAAEKFPPPTLAFHFGLVEHGYEIHMFDEGKYCGAQCRDFSGNHKVSDLKESLVDAIEKMFKAWRAKL